MMICASRGKLALAWLFTAFMYCGTHGVRPWVGGSKHVHINLHTQVLSRYMTFTYVDIRPYTDGIAGYIILNT